MSTFESFAQSQGYNQGGFPNPMNYQQSYNQAKPVYQMTDPLTDEQRNILKSQYEDAFDLKVSPQELAYAICAHKKDNKFDIVPDEHGNAICKTCGAKFNPDIVTEEYVQQATDMIMNVMQTAKFLAVDLNVDVFRQYFSMIPYLQRVPKLFKAVQRSFNNYSGNQYNPAQQYYGAPNINMMFDMMMNPSVPMGGYGYMNQGYPQTPFMNQQAAMVNPGPTPFYQNPHNPYGNPMPPQGVPMQQPPQNQQQPPQAQPADNKDATVKQQVQL